MYRQTPFLLVALLGMGLILWSGIATLWPHPYAGFEILGSGVVHEADRIGPAEQAGIRVGDVVVSVDGRPLHTLVWRLFADRGPGDTASIDFRRDGEVRTAELVLSPTPRRQTIFNAERLLVGLIFWLVGTIIWMVRPEDSPARAIFLMCQVVAVVVLGEVLDPGVPIMAKITDVVRFFLAPAVLHAFVFFPPALTRKTRQVLLRAAYSGAVLVTLLFLIASRSSFETQLWRMFEVAVLAVALGVLIRPQRDASLDTRRRRRLLIAGMCAGSAPIVLLTLATLAVQGKALIPYEWTLPAIAIVPVAFAYATFKGDLGRVDLILNRGVVYLGLTTFLLAMYALVFLVLQSIFPTGDLKYAVSGVSLVAFGTMAFVPLRSRLQRSVDRAFYGGWYDYRTFVQSVSGELGRTVSLEDLIARLRMAGETMRFHSGALLWPREGIFVPRAAYGYRRHRLMSLRLSESSALIRWFAVNTGPVTGDELLRLIPTENLSENEHALLAAPEITYWLPLSCRDKLRSVLVFGERQADERLDREDNAILATLSTQAAFACENIQLLESLRNRLAEVEQIRDELAETQARLFEGREEERLHLARELHDGPVQDLYALLHETNGQAVADSGLGSIEERRRTSEVVDRVAATLRDICTDLRPPFLNELGLDVAIRSHLARIQEQHPPLRVVLDLKPYTERLSERTELALFRICQEAVNNAIHRGEAAQISVRFEADAEGILLEVADNGRGFQIPDRWIEFGRQGRLGLLGIAERTDSIGGRLEVESVIGRGTSLRVHVTLPEEYFDDSSRVGG